MCLQIILRVNLSCIICKFSSRTQIRVLYNLGVNLPLNTFRLQVSQVGTDPVSVDSPEAVSLSVDLAAADSTGPPPSVAGFGTSTPKGSFKHKVFWDRTRGQVPSSYIPCYNIARLSGVWSCESEVRAHRQSYESLNPASINLSTSKIGN